MPEIANMIHCPPPWSYVYPKAGIEFREKYLPIIKEEKTLNLGMRYACAIAHKDVIEALHKIHEYRVLLYLLYTKALGYSGIESSLIVENTDFQEMKLLVLQRQKIF